MAGEAENEVPAGLGDLVQAIRELIPALYAMAESNCRVAEALVAVGGEAEPEDEAEQRTYLDGTPVV